MLEIPFIYADDCLDCIEMKAMLVEAIRESHKDCVIKEFNSEDPKAIEVAIDRGIEDIPGCAIGEAVFFGKRGYSYEEILVAFKRL